MFNFKNKRWKSSVVCDRASAPRTFKVLGVETNICKIQMMIFLLILLALALLVKTVSPYVAFSPETLYTAPVPHWMRNVDPGLNFRLS